jgi:transcriptional regulator with XRE-family HTH domain
VPRPGPPKSIGGEDDLALRIQREREKRGWSTAGLAQRMTEVGCPLNQSAIWKIENGQPRRRITVDEAIAFARVFGMTFEDLLIPWQVAQSTEAAKLWKQTVRQVQELADIAEIIEANSSILSQMYGADVFEAIEQQLSVPGGWRRRPSDYGAIQGDRVGDIYRAVMHVVFKRAKGIDQPKGA